MTLSVRRRSYSLHTIGLNHGSRTERVISVNLHTEAFSDTSHVTAHVSLHIPATAETKGSINFELMNSMPKGAIVVNTARKEVMDEAGLAKMLEERPDFKYLTDIMPAIHAELAEKYAGRYFSTPKKMGAQTAEANINAGIAAAKQIVDFLVNGNEKYRVNK